MKRDPVTFEKFRRRANDPDPRQPRGRLQRAGELRRCFGCDLVLYRDPNSLDPCPKCGAKPEPTL